MNPIVFIAKPTAGVTENPEDQGGGDKQSGCTIM